MTSLGTVTAKVAVKPAVSVGVTTVAGGTVTVAAYAVAVVAFIQGARDEQTISALVIGTLSLLTTLGGRYAQAVAAVLALRRAPELPASQPFVAAGSSSGNTVSTLTWTEPHPGVAVTNPVTPPTTPDWSGEIPGGGVPPEDAS